MGTGILIMEKIYYRISINSNCLTECKHFKDGTMVGSLVCQECKYHESHNESHQVVNCNYPEENKMLNTKYYVYEPSSGYTKFQHNNEEAARKETERLARDNPGKTFIVLKSIASCCVNNIKWEEHKEIEHEIPF